MTAVLGRIVDGFGKMMALIKARSTFLVALSTMTGFLIAKGTFNPVLFLAAIGTFLLASGASALNEYQEHAIDALMNRTRNRPIPAGAIKPTVALVIVFILIAAGLTILFIGTNATAASLGLFALFWYNAIYTPLKRKTAFALIPGAIIGAMPPMIGFVSGGGRLSDPRILMVALFFFIWQIPHFWLLVMIHSQDYQRAKLPTLTRTFSDEQLMRITSVWMIAAAITCVLLPLFGVLQLPGFNLALITVSIWLVRKAILLFAPVKSRISPAAAFKGINLYALLVILLIALEKLVTGYSIGPLDNLARVMQ